VRKIAENLILATRLILKEGVVLRTLAYGPAAVWAALLLFLGGRSDVPTVETPLPLDKAAHFLLYGLLGVLVAKGWQWAQRWPALLWPVLLAALVGVADELHQRSVPGRSSELIDWLADGAGILTGCGLMLRWAKDSGNAD
jgi:VanZ family protein